MQALGALTAEERNLMSWLMEKMLRAIAHENDEDRVR